MQANKKMGIAAVVVLLASFAAAQVLSPSETTDVLGQRLQLMHAKQLQQMARDLAAQKFPYHFYFSRALGVDELRQQQMDQRSVGFAKHDGLSVLQITGNYYACYPGETMDRQERARRTLNDVVLPMLKIAVKDLGDDDSFGGYAFEVSYHVASRVMGINHEGTENLAVVLPRHAAERLARAANPNEQQAALLDGMAYLDAQPILLWVTAERPSEDEQAGILKNALAREQGNGTEMEGAMPLAMRSGAPLVSPRILPIPAWLQPKPVTDEDLGKLNVRYGDLLASLPRDLGADADFVSYAPPTFIRFKDAAFLQLSLDSRLDPADHGTQYKLAALAFDEHIAHLIRPLLKRLPADAAFSGVDLSTTVKLAGDAKPESVEFFFTMPGLKCFADYECSGQQLVANSVVLINGERADIDLERAEAETR